MRIVLTWSADNTTITAAPLAKKDRLPPIRKLVIENGQTYAVPFGLFPERICIGAIPGNYNKKSADQYAIIFMNDNAPKARRRKTAAKCI